MDLNISEHNKQIHEDIETDMQKQKDGLFTFILRIHNTKVVDYNLVEYTDVTDYVRLKRIILEKIST